MFQKSYHLQFKAIKMSIKYLMRRLKISSLNPVKQLSYNFIKSAMKRPLVWGAGSEKPSFFFPSDLYSSCSESCWGTVGTLAEKPPTWDTGVWETQIPQELVGTVCTVYWGWSRCQQLSHALCIRERSHRELKVQFMTSALPAAPTQRPL